MLERKPDFIAVKLPRKAGAGADGQSTKAVIFQAVGDGSLSVAKPQHVESTPKRSRPNSRARVRPHTYTYRVSQQRVELTPVCRCVAEF